MKKLLIAIAVLVALVWGGWLVAIPSKVLVEMAEDAARRGGMEIRLNGFKKGLFYDFTIESLDVAANGSTMLTLENARGRLDLLYLLTLKARVPFSATLSGGGIKGTAIMSRNGYSIKATANAIELGGLDIGRMTGTGIKGMLRGDAWLDNGFGKVKFIVNDAHVDPVTVQGMQVPLDMFNTITGAVHIDGPKLDIDSIAFEGSGLYARITGTVEKNVADIQLEFMPDDSVIPDAILQSVIGQYRLSRGHYVIPYKGPLRGAF